MRMIAVAPLFSAPSRLSISRDIDLGLRVSIERIPAWLIDDSILQELSPHHRDMLKDEIEYALIAEEDEPSTVRGSEASGQSILHSLEEKLTLASLSLWLAKPSALRSEVIVTAEVESESKVIWRNIANVESIYPHKNYLQAELIETDVDKAATLYLPILSVPRPSVLWVAIYSLFTALTNRTWEVRFPVLWIAIEALFGCENPHEITYRLSNRLAFFLAEDRSAAREICSLAHANYNWRSKLMHGRLLWHTRQDESDEIIVWAEMCVRDSIVKILSDPELIKVFSGRKREQYLDDLLFT